MRAKDVASALPGLIDAGMPVFLWGPPGVGKSSLIRKVASDTDRKLVDVRTVLLDPVDLRGLPTVRDSLAHWCVPSFLPRSGRGILFLDELPQAVPAVQSACLQLVLDRRLGEYDLPDGWQIVAAGNRAEDRAGSQRMISPLLNRFMHLDLEVSVEDWMDWSLTAGVSAEIRAFIAYRPALLMAFKPSDNAKSFPTPRSWEYVSRILPTTTTTNLLPLVSGCVGEGAAAEFCGFLRVFRGLPDIDQVLAAASTCTIPTEPSVLYALCGALGERAKGAKKAELEAIYTIAGRMPAEYGILLVRDTVSVNKASLLLPAASRWIASHRDLLLGSEGSAK